MLRLNPVNIDFGLGKMTMWAFRILLGLSFLFQVICIRWPHLQLAALAYVLPGLLTPVGLIFMTLHKRAVRLVGFWLALACSILGIVPLIRSVMNLSGFEFIWGLDNLGWVLVVVVLCSFWWCRGRILRCVAALLYVHWIFTSLYLFEVTPLYLSEVFLVVAFVVGFVRIRTSLSFLRIFTYSVFLIGMSLSVLSICMARTKNHYEVCWDPCLILIGIVQLLWAVLIEFVLLEQIRIRESFRKNSADEKMPLRPVWLCMSCLCWLFVALFVFGMVALLKVPAEDLGMNVLRFSTVVPAYVWSIIGAIDNLHCALIVSSFLGAWLSFGFARFCRVFSDNANAVLLLGNSATFWSSATSQIAELRKRLAGLPVGRNRRDAFDAELATCDAEYKIAHSNCDKIGSRCSEIDQWVSAEENRLRRLVE